jgi:prepilin-type processing-associated H-X9-DG protein
MGRHPHAASILIEYLDGAKATMLHADGHAEGRAERDILLTFETNAGKVEIHNHVDPGFPESHYIAQLRAIDEFFRTGVSPVPVERTLLCNGILDAAMRSRAAGGTRIATPELAISYAV